MSKRTLQRGLLTLRAWGRRAVGSRFSLLNSVLTHSGRLTLRCACGDVDGRSRGRWVGTLSSPYLTHDFRDGGGSPDEGVHGFTRLVDRLDAVITARADRAACEMGLTITRLPGGRTQYYRSPIWDRRQLCDACRGTWAQTCPTCGGRGVVTRDAVWEGGVQR